MSQEQHLRFSVEESVWFQKGQEVSELLSISLEPDISIHEHDQYISIRGALQLTGEYKIDNEAQEQDQFQFANVRYVNEVQTGEDGISIINHRFPVDITIPSNRIENLDEVYVSIESFDYEIPELKCLKLVADLSISGILNDQPQSTEPAEEEERQEEEVFEELFREPQSQAWDPYEKSLSFEANTTKPFSSFYPEEEPAEEDVDKLSLLNSQQEQARKEEQEVEGQSTTSHDEFVAAASRNDKIEESQEEEAHWQEEEQQDQQDEQEELYNPFVVEVRKEEQETIEPQEVQYSFYSKSEGGPATNENQDEVVEDEAREEEEPKDSHYLTSLFARDGEEDFSRLKMCIVQQGDTLELICERYELSVQQLLRVNDLQTTQDIHEGQILYIPSLSTSNK